MEKKSGARSFHIHFCSQLPQRERVRLCPQAIRASCACSLAFQHHTSGAYFQYASISVFDQYVIDVRSICRGTQQGTPYMSRRVRLDHAFCGRLHRPCLLSIDSFGQSHLIQHRSFSIHGPLASCYRSFRTDVTLRKPHLRPRTVPCS